MPNRLIAVGDQHGDCAAFDRVLQLAGLISEGHWCGDDAVLVQIGDVLDRGDEEKELLDLIRSLKSEAAAQGGRVITLLGNHEIMRAAGINVYASARAMLMEGGEAAFYPGSHMARELSQWPIVCIVGDTAFVHAGLTAEAVQQLQQGRVDVGRWLRGEGGISLPPELLWPRSPRSPRSPVWMRDLSDPPDTEPDAASCAELSDALSLIGAKRLVVGHTVQSRINGACRAGSSESAIYRIDVGLSSAMQGASPQALEISRDGSVRVLTAELRS